MSRSRLGVLVALALAVAACRGASKKAAAASPLPDPPYFGQPVPGTTPAKFAPDVVSTDAIELNGAFTPDGREFLFTRQIDGIATMYRSVYENGTWSDPQPLLVFPDRAQAVAVDMSVSPDGRFLYFLGQYPSEQKPSSDIWVSERTDGGWSTARKVPPPISTSAEEVYPLVVADGSLYFSSNRGGERSQVYRAQRTPDGGFDEPVKVPAPVANEEAGTGDTFVAPDESYLVLASRRAPSFGNGDLFVAFRTKDGGWTEPVSLGETINTAEHEFCPMVTPDGKYLFFSRRWGSTWENTTAGDVYWVDAKVLEALRPKG
jgi:Tol biopolymer transport system component